MSEKVHTETSHNIRVAVVGAAGRMGREVIQAVAAHPRTSLSAAVDLVAADRAPDDVAHVLGIQGVNVPLTADIHAALERSDIVIDFSSHELTPRLAMAAKEARRPLVCGTTGIDPAGLDALKSASQVVAVVASPNMSLGMNLLFRLVREVVTTLGEDYDVEVVEWHHRNKKDAPSGTALRLADIAAKAMGHSLEDTGTFSRHGLVGPRRRGEIGVAAVRAGDVVGDHTVIFGGEGERLELVHRVSSRRAFANGALTAALWAMDRPAGLYDMQDVLGLNAK